MQPPERGEGKDKLEPIKVLVVGPYGAGKSSLVRALARDAISVETFGSSVSLDFGSMVLGRHEVNIFGTPGKKDFLFMQQVLGVGAGLCILVVDAQNTDDVEEARDIYESLKEVDVPIIVVANKQDLDGAIEPVLLRRLLSLGEERIVGTSALEGEGLEDLVEAIEEALKERDST